MLLGLLIALRPMAFASPPDQSWLGGLFDDADYDDVILLVTGATPVVSTNPDFGPVPERVLVGAVTVTDEPSVVPPTLSSHRTRAPPAL